MDEKILKGLNETIEKLRKDNNLLWKYKEAYYDLEKQCRDLFKKLDVKRKVINITGYKKDEPLVGYRLMILDDIDTPEGMFIKVQL